MPLPLFLGIAAAVAAAGGVGAGVHGAVKMKNANDAMKDAQERHEWNIKKAGAANKVTTQSMDNLGKKELTVLESFQKFADLLEKIHNRPDFKECRITDVELPAFDPEQIRQVSVGAGVLLGGVGGAAVGTLGGFAAAGVTTAAVMALGTASTGTAIAGLSGAAATNATLAALGGGALAAGGGGIALGTTILGAKTLGVGLLVGGAIFGIVGASLSKKAEEARHQVSKEGQEVDRICTYLRELNEVAVKYYKAISKVDDLYRPRLDKLYGLVYLDNKRDWLEYSSEEKMLVENLVLLVQVLFKMCQVQIVFASEKENELNTINTMGVNGAIYTAEKAIRSRNFSM